MVEVYAAVRQFVFNDGKSRREAARVFGLSRETVSKMCRFSMPPGYVRQRPAAKPKLGPLIPVVEAILEADRTAPVKQRHTAKRIFKRLRDEHRFAGGYTVVKDHVRIERARGRRPSCRWRIRVAMRRWALANRGKLPADALDLLAFERGQEIASRPQGTSGGTREHVPIICTHSLHDGSSWRPGGHSAVERMSRWRGRGEEWFVRQVFAEMPSSD